MGTRISLEIGNFIGKCLYLQNKILTDKQINGHNY